MRSAPSFAGFGQLVQGLFLAILAMLVVFLILLAVQNWRGFKKKKKKMVDAEASDAPPTSVLGMDIRRGSLPPDVPDAARALWQEGRFEEALALLYRGSISALVHGHHLRIRDSDTERDLLARVRGTLRDARAEEDPVDIPRGTQGFVARLTRAWINLAYGRTRCNPDAFEDLCNTWPFADRRKGRSS